MSTTAASVVPLRIVKSLLFAAVALTLVLLSAIISTDEQIVRASRMLMDKHQRIPDQEDVFLRDQGGGGGDQQLVSVKSWNLLVRIS